MTDAEISALYKDGVTASDLRDVRPGTVILEPIHAPTKLGTRLHAAAPQALSTQALAYRVVAWGAPIPKDDLQIKDGDIVTVVNATLDPVDTRAHVGLVRTSSKFIWAIIGDEP